MLDQPTCSISDCQRLAHTRGWCRLHYIRWTRHGDPTVTRRLLGGDPLTRFSLKVQRSDHPQACWLWVGAKDQFGYGRFRVAPGQAIAAHRFSYEAHVAPIPDGLHIDHLCRVHNCVNPLHLEPVTPDENNRRAMPFRQIKSGCKRGHAYTDADTYVDRDGGRSCRVCNRERARKARA